MTDGVNGGYSLSDIAALMGNHNDGIFGGGSGIGGILIILFFLIFAGGFGGQLGGSAYATSNEVQRGFDNQNSMANEREILASVTAGTAQSVAATNQVFHDLVGYVGDKYNELDRDILSVGSAVQTSIANQNKCCCDTLRAIDGVNYNNAMNTASINATSTANAQKILDAISQSKIDALEGKVAELQLANQMSNVVRYPNAWTWNAGPSPFCGGCGCGF